MRQPSRITVAFLSTLALSACGKATEPAAVAEHAPTEMAPKGAPAAAPAGAEAMKQPGAGAPEPLAQKKFGAEITEKSSTPLPELIKEPGRFTAKTVRTEGVVSAVCQEMGCWMEIADASGQAHIKMAGHSFFVPKSASGHHAVIQGKVLTAEKDGCAEEAEAATGKVAKVQIEASGIQFVD